MRTDNTAWDFDDVVDELRFLRKSTGFTPMRYYDLLVIPSLLGGRRQNFCLSRMYFIDAIRALHDTRLRDALLVAFGLMKDYEDYRYVPVKQILVDIQSILCRFNRAIRRKVKSIQGVVRIKVMHHSLTPSAQRVLDLFYHISAGITRIKLPETKVGFNNHALTVAVSSVIINNIDKIRLALIFTFGIIHKAYWLITLDTKSYLSTHISPFRYKSRAQIRNVLCVVPKIRAASRADIWLLAQAARTLANSAGRFLGGLPNFTPLAFAAAMPSAWRWCILSRSLWAT